MHSHLCLGARMWGYSREHHPRGLSCETNICIGVQTHTERVLVHFRWCWGRVLGKVKSGLHRHLQSLTGELLTYTTESRL